MAEFEESVHEKFSVNLKPFQKKALDALLSKQDVYLSVKTGGGKSLCFQCFPLCYMGKNSKNCKVLIVSPLISIMKEQTEYLNSIGYSATYIGKEDNEQKLLDGEYQFVFTSPESILSITKWRNMLTSPPYKNVELFVVDEAHTVLQWGENAHGDNPFREWYGKLGEIRSLTECPILLITATASASARKSMRKKFCMSNYVEIIDNPDRENVKLFFSKVKSSVPLQDMFSFLITEVKQEKAKCQRCIIFCTSIKTCGDLFSMFRLELKDDIQFINMYHSKTPDPMKEKIKVEMNDPNGNLRILIATSAAGMGVNFTDLNKVINFGPPKDTDSFVQQIGRAGRDPSTKAKALLLCTGRQCRNLDDDMKMYINNDGKCRREILLSFYNATPDKDRYRHDCCDLCAKDCKCEHVDCNSFSFVHPYVSQHSDDEDSSSSGSETQSEHSSDL